MKNQLFHVIELLLQDNPFEEDLKLETAAKINIVCPPKEFCDKRNEWQLNQSMRWFREEVCSFLHRELNDNPNITLPSIFKKCSKKKHFDCKNCTQGIIVNVPLQEFYDRYYKFWQEVRVKNDQKKHKTLTEAPLADGKVLAAFHDTFNHREGINLFSNHREGINLFSIEELDFDYYGEVLFFFQFLDKLNITHYHKQLNDLIKEGKVQKEKEETEWRLKIKQEELEWLKLKARTWEIFK